MAADLRASDRDREAATLRLRADHLEGRLTVEELEERIAAAQAATTVTQLAALRADLPQRRPIATPTRAAMPWLPGRRGFTQRTIVDAAQDVVVEQAMAYLVPALDTIGLRLFEHAADLLVFSNGRDRATLRLQPAGPGRTLLVAHGHAPLAIRRAFARLAA